VAYIEKKEHWAIAHSEILGLIKTYIQIQYSFIITTPGPLKMQLTHNENKFLPMYATSLYSIILSIYFVFHTTTIKLSNTDIKLVRQMLNYSKQLLAKKDVT